LAFWPWENFSFPSHETSEQKRGKKRHLCDSNSLFAAIYWKGNNDVV
jgi:hypothetical protein